MDKPSVPSIQNFKFTFTGIHPEHKVSYTGKRVSSDWRLLKEFLLSEGWSKLQMVDKQSLSDRFFQPVNGGE